MIKGSTSSDSKLSLKLSAQSWKAELAASNNSFLRPESPSPVTPLEGRTPISILEEDGSSQSSSLELPDSVLGLEDCLSLGSDLSDEVLAWGYVV
jgi:hypothetical protein